MDVTSGDENFLKNLANFYIDTVLILENPSIVADFPEFPNKCPKKLVYKLPSNDTAPKKRAKPKKVDNESIAVTKKEKLEIVYRNQQNGTRSTRKTRFVGHYTFEIPDEPDDEECFVVSTVKKEEKADNDTKESEFFTALNMMRTKSNLSIEPATSSKSLISSNTFVIKKSQTLSDTSSDEEDNSSSLSSIDVVPTSSCDNKNEGLVVKLYRPINDKTIPKVPSKSRLEENIRKSQEIKKVPNGHITKRSVQPQKPLIQNSKVLKSVFQESSSFDEAMKKYSKRNQEIQQKFGKAKIIPAPENDPMVKKLKRIPKKPIEVNQPNLSPKNSKEHLGGIFTIHNGWDKQEENKKNDGNKTEETNVNGHKLQRHVTPPNIVRENLSDDIMDAHNTFMNNEEFMENMLLARSSTTSFHSNLSDFGNPGNSKMCETNGNIESESDEEIKPMKKIQRLSYSDDENESENVNGHHEDVLTLCADMGDFDDFEEETNGKKVNGEIMTEVDDLKLKVSKTTKIKPLDLKTEFDLNTKQITQHIVDPETDRILKTYFGDICPAFLENRCSMPNCIRKHHILDESIVRPLIINAPSSALKSIFPVTLRFHRLLQMYISIFVEYCIKTKDDLGLVELVKACDRHPRTISCYKNIVQKLIETGYMKTHRAINFIIENHNDSEIARDTILSMIVESGPTLTWFMPYIVKVHVFNPISIDMFSKILDTCVAYQNPNLPKFCLDYLEGCSPAQMNSLNKQHLGAFIRLNKCLMEFNEHREAKTMSLLSKLMQ